MRIAYVIGHYPAVTHTFVMREIQRMRDLGFEVETFSIWPAAERDLLSQMDREEAERTDALLPFRPARVATSHLRALRRSPSGYVATLRRALALSSPGLRRRALSSARFVQAMMLWDSCRRRDVRHIHAELDGTAPMISMLATEFANFGAGDSTRWTWSHRMHGSKEFYEIYPERLAERAASASFIACISDYTRSQVMAFVPEELWDKLIVVRCGVDPEQFVPGQPRRDPGPRILTVGRVDAMKGTVLLLQALAELHRRGVPARLTIVGDGPSKAKAVDFARRLGVVDLVDWAGAVGQDRIRDFYAECDVFCLPSFAEGIPIVLMEAMAMEVPVIANAITGIVELVEDGVSGFLVRPGRVDLLTDRLERLLTDPGLRQRMGTAGRGKVRAEYDLASNARELSRLFANGLGAG